MTKYYRDFYGCTAKIVTYRDGSARLSICAGFERTTKKYASERGAKIAMGKQSDGWREIAQ